MKKIIVFFLGLTFCATFLFAQDIERNVKERLTDYFNQYTATAKISTPKLNSFDINYDRKTIAIYASESFAYQPFRPETVENIYNQVKELLPGPVHYYQLTIYADGKPIEDLVPNFYRNKKKDKERLSLNVDYKGAPWVKNTSRPNEISRGLQDRHIAIWQSHGNYFKNDKNEWGWQRPRLFCTTEDMFTQSFVLPYVIPMLENAGAIVYTPRERDTQKNEIIVDNDTPNASLYLEMGGKKINWANAPVRGFFISGADARFYPATAAIQGSKLELSAPEVPQPVAVRYGYGNFFRVNLYNKAGLPAVPFRTDHFAPDTYARWFADSEMRRFPKAYQLDHGRRLFFGYAQGVGCCAMLRMWRQTGERHYFDYVEAWVDSLINEKGEIHLYDMSTYNLDFINSGKVLFDVYRETGNDKYKKAMDELIKQLKRHPRTLEGGYWHKLIYQHQMWLDGLYMASPFMAQYGAEFNRPEWIDEAVKQFALCHKHTYDAGTGLYHHAWDESKSQRWANPETGHSPNFWGRSIGWWFMALVDALDYIPEEHPGRSDMISWIQGLADTLPKYQDKAGLWYQVIDQPKREGNFPEASVTSQCMYAYAKAVNKGYIDAKYKAVAEKAFKGLKDKLLVENADGTLTLTRCCQVGGLGGHPYRDGSFEYYIGEKMRDNDAKATGPFIMGCLELNK